MKSDSTGETGHVAATDAAPEMTPEFIQGQCRRHHGYSTPELNEKLYLHHFGFQRIANLGAYTACMVLYLSHNSIDDLSPLAGLPNLQSLYISSNGLTSCTSLPLIPTLRTLDVSYNLLHSLAGIAEAAESLDCLLASHNVIESIGEDTFAGFCELVSLDLSHNRIADPQGIYEVVTSSPSAATLRTCIFTGNEFVRRVSAYRKSYITALPALRYLDEYPVFPEERERAVAYVRGGWQAEKNVKAAIAKRESMEKKRQFAFFDAALEEPRRQKAAHGPKTHPSHYFTSHADNVQGDDDDLFSDPVYVPQ